MPTRQKIHIIGAGIGGLTTAIALWQKGHDVHVHERAPEIREVGAGKWVAPNAMKIYAELGLAEKIAAAGFALQRISVADVHRRLISTIDGDRVRAQHGHTTISIHRAALQKILAAEIPAERIHLHAACTSYTQDTDSVTAHFSDGRSVTGDVLLFADGIHSAGRKQLHPDHPLRYSGQTCWRFVADASLPHPENMFELWSQKKGVRVGFSPISAQQVYVFITAYTPAGGMDDKSRLQSYLLDLCADFDAEVLGLIRQADPDGIIRSDLFDFAPIRRWTDGRMALLGDAAHATTPNLGQGACQAIEDARILAQVLDAGEEVSQALLRYQTLRMEKAHYITNTSWQFARLTNTSGFMKTVVKAILRSTPESITNKQMDRIYNL